MPEYLNSAITAPADPTLDCLSLLGWDTIILLSRFSLPRLSPTRKLGNCCNVCATQSADR